VEFSDIGRYTGAIEGYQMQTDKILDVCGLQCPLPLLKAKKALSELPCGAILCVIATDPSSQRDFQAFAELSTHQLLKTAVEEGKYSYWLQKGV
jgi:TusA-related sulfurtransferase